MKKKKHKINTSVRCLVRGFGCKEPESGVGFGIWVAVRYITQPNIEVFFNKHPEHIILRNWAVHTAYTTQCIPHQFAGRANSVFYLFSIPSDYMYWLSEWNVVRFLLLRFLFFIFHTICIFLSSEVIWAKPINIILYNNLLDEYTYIASYYLLSLILNGQGTKWKQYRWLLQLIIEQNQENSYHLFIFLKGFRQKKKRI